MSKYRHVLHDKREEKLRSLLIHDFYSNNIKKKNFTNLSTRKIIQWNEGQNSNN
jgi:hypothetical protein